MKIFHRDIKSSGAYYGIFNDSFPPIMDGVTLTVENYARLLPVTGHPSCVVTPWNPVSAKYPYRVMRYFSVPIANRYPYRYGYPKLDPFIWQRLRKTPFRLVHSHCPFSSGRLAVYVKRKQHVPLIGTFHSKYRTDLEHSFKHMPWCIPIIMRRILNFFNACDEVWIPQARVEETVREYGYKGHLEVVDNGIDYADMADKANIPMSDYKSLAKETLGIPADQFALLFVGQHIEAKGILLIADALALLKDKVNFTMNYIGNGYALPQLKERIQNHGLSSRVNINGVIQDRKVLARYYAASDLFLFPSMYDNAPLVLREAAAMGTPGILPFESTASEVIADGVNGFLTRPTPAAYAELIEKLYHDRNLVALAGQSARNSLVRGWEDVVEEVADRYNSLLKRHGRV
ncbi:MAG: glycosyltransferase [Muribaculum sp.]|nr:glycosyltransferase [Muribaculum sp.]